MDVVESIVSHIQALSNSPAELDQLAALLKRSQKQIRTESTRFFSALSQLDPSIHSLGYLYILYVYLLFVNLISSNIYVTCIN